MERRPWSESEQALIAELYPRLPAGPEERGAAQVGTEVCEEEVGVKLTTEKRILKFLIFWLLLALITILWRWIEIEAYGVSNPNSIDTFWGIVLAASLTANITNIR